jgi:hypothetical protein
MVASDLVYSANTNKSATERLYDKIKNAMDFIRNQKKIPISKALSESMNNIDLEKRITEIINELSQKKGWVSSVDVLMKLNYLADVDYENWRFGRVDSLENICKTNLNKLKTINQIIRRTSVEMNLKPSWTAYNKYGKGAKKRLQFSKSGNAAIENAYSTHYIVVKQHDDPVQN